MSKDIFRLVGALGFGVLAVWSALEGLSGLPIFFGIMIFLLLNSD